MTKINAVGEQCPLPVIRTKKALDAVEQGTVETVVDNEIAVENLLKLAAQLGCSAKVQKDAPGHYAVTIEKTGPAKKEMDFLPRKGKTVVAVGSNQMGQGDEAFSKTLLKGFLFALTQLEHYPDMVIFYNSGAFLTTAESESLEDLKKLAAAGCEILTCGMCMNYYRLGERPAVGSATNMYRIAEILTTAEKVIRP